MIVLYTSDIHVDPEHLHRLLNVATELRADAVIIGGDLIPVGGRTIAEIISEQSLWIKEILIPALASFRRDFPNTPLFMDFGNDDLMATRPLLEERDGNELNLIHGRVMPLGEKWALAAYMTIPPTPFLLKDREKADCHDRTGLDGNARRSGIRTDGGRERDCDIDPSDGTMEDGLKDLTDHLQSSSLYERPFVFVAHSPPLDTALDIIPGGQNVGSLAVRRFIERWGPTGRPLISLHGHIHESPFISGKVYDRIADVPCFNLGQRFGELRALVFDLGDIKGSINLVIFDKKIKRHKILMRS
jgi:Icc-related predicted phosphoesterase